MRILISGTCAPALNSNYELIEAIVDGFRALNGPEVALITVAQLPRLYELKPHLTLLVGGLALETIPLALVHHLCSSVGSQFVFWSLEDPYELDWVLEKGVFFDLILLLIFLVAAFIPENGMLYISH